MCNNKKFSLYRFAEQQKAAESEIFAANEGVGNIKHLRPIKIAKVPS